MKVAELLVSLLKAFVALIAYVLGMAIGSLIEKSIVPPLAGVLMVLLVKKLWSWKRPIFDVGLQWKGYGLDFLLGSLIGVGMIGVGTLFLLSIGSIEVDSYSFNPATLGVIFVTFVTVAIGEEVCFRGVVLSSLMESMNRYVALFMSAVFFSVPHLLNPNASFASFTGILLAGMLLGASYIFTKNLWMPIGFHLFWNFTQSIVGFNVSGIPGTNLLNISYPYGYNFINGGAFGFEASLVSYVLVIVVLAIIIYYYSNAEKYDYD